MAEKDTVYKGKFKQSGIYNYKDFYEFLYDLFMDEGYDVHESKYLEKIRGENKDVEIVWTANKDIRSNYLLYSIKIEWIILGMRKVKVKREGEETTMDSGTLEIKFTGILIKDHNNQWDNSFFKNLRKIYDNYIIRNRIKDHEIKLFEEVNEFILNAKSYLALEGLHEY